MTAKCSASRVLLDHDRGMLDSLYGAESYSPEAATCDLEEGHQHLHVGHVSIQVIGKSVTVWWMSWDAEYHEATYAIFTAPFCLKKGCLSISGHAGDHVSG